METAGHLCCVELANGFQAGSAETFQMAPETDVEALRFLPWRNRTTEYKFLPTKAKTEIKLVFPVKHGNYFCGSVLVSVICESHRGHTCNESHNSAI